METLRIRVAWQSGESEIFEFEQDEISIGRSKENDLTIRGAAGVSRYHAKITIEDDEVFIQDLGSTNGTVVNDQPITRIAIESHDVIEIGDVWLRAALDGAGEKSLEKYPLGNKGVSKLKQLAVRAPRASSCAMGEARLISAISDSIPKIWDMVNKPNVQSVLITPDETTTTYVDGDSEASGYVVEEKILDAIKKSFEIFVGDAENDHKNSVLKSSLQNGLSISVLSPPAIRNGTTILLEKSFVDSFSISELCNVGAINSSVVHMLQAGILENRRFIVAGGSADSGLALSKFIPQESNICLIDSMSRVVLSRMDIHSINPEAIDQEEISKIMAITARAGIDYYLVDDFTANYGGAIIRALAAGFAGCVGYLPSRSLEHTVSRLELVLAQVYNGAPVRTALRRELVCAVDVIIQLEESRDSLPKIKRVTKLLGVDKNGSITTADVFSPNKAPGTEKLNRPMVPQEKL
jgi:Flp pilus assembly CpaF family ATPase